MKGIERKRNGRPELASKKKKLKGSTRKEKGCKKLKTNRNVSKMKTKDQEDKNRWRR
jgi:hypothetical protein